jgi:proton glutamate symport protein
VLASDARRLGDRASSRSRKHPSEPEYLLKLALHWKILIGLTLGVAFGLLATALGFSGFVGSWISPFGEIFISLLRLIAVPLIFASLISGVASLSNIASLSRIGGKAVALYIATTLVAIAIGLLLVNGLQPGLSIDDELRDRIAGSYAQEIELAKERQQQAGDRRALDPLVEIVPDNIFSAAADNRRMLQVVFFALLFGIALTLAETRSVQGVKDVIAGLNAVLLKIVDIIMLAAPFGVFALMASTIASIAGDDPRTAAGLIRALGFYVFVVAAGLAIHVVLVYGTLIRAFTSVGLKRFFSAIIPAQLVAFSTSSAAATLPVSMECVEEGLGVRNAVASFVLPVGATINLDGTALYQGVSVVFIAQALGLDLGLGAQLSILLTALLASIGTAPVPGAGLVMLVMVLESAGVPSAGLALILGVDRILDMLRTTTNVTGDCAMATLIDATEPETAPAEPSAR